jgi:hypothetical protein
MGLGHRSAALQRNLGHSCLALHTLLMPFAAMALGIQTSSVTQPS